MERLTELLFCQVVSRDGKRLGHVFDIRCVYGSNDKPPISEELIYGTKGFLEVLGFKKTYSKRLSWDAIERIERGKIFVTAETCR
jgi:hypothetical protein